MEQLKYKKLSQELERQILADQAEGKVNPYRFNDENALRRDMNRDRASLLRPAFIRDIDKILHLPVYNRYNDKTQVFSFYLNDDITRRGYHVQLVSRIARNIGRLLGLNLDLIEAMALGHDLGHTPFGHAGEKYLSELMYNETGRYFNHNVHSTRVLDVLYRRNVSLQTLDGILCHNGEFELKEYRPRPLCGFEEYDKNVESCYTEGYEAIKSLVPSTLEGCVVRVSDMIAYVGKDRQDAVTAKIIDENHPFSSQLIGTQNAQMINNLVVYIVENSYGKDYIQLGGSAYSDLKTAKKENGDIIYFNKNVNEMYEGSIRPMFGELYYKLLEDVKSGSEDTVVFRHHIQHIEENIKYYQEFDYRSQEPNQIVADYIASMTDDYFVALHKKLFPDSKYSIEYKSYFED